MMDDKGIVFDEVDYIAVKRSEKSDTTIESEYFSSTVTNLTRESQYLSYYDLSSLFKKIPDTRNCLAKTVIECDIRAKVVDWMVEVLFKLHDELNYPDIFRSIMIFDLYLKNTEKNIELDEIELIAVTAAYITCKYEYNDHFKAAHFCTIACHNKFTESQVFETEIAILRALKFTLKHTTSLEILYCHLHDYFSVDQNQFEELQTLCSFFLLQTLMDVRFNDINMVELSCCVMIVGVQSLFATLVRKAFKKNDIEMTQLLASQEKFIIMTIIGDSQFSGCNFNTVNIIRNHLREFNVSFKKCSFVLSIISFAEGTD